MSDSNLPNIQVDPSSYRDPSGFVFHYNHEVYRQVNNSFKEHYDFFISSGLYKSFVEKKMLIEHSEMPDDFIAAKDKYKILKPEQLSFISYAGEWCFGMLKDAALLTIRITKESLNRSMVLKDATPYNIQWQNGRLVFIDTLSFEKYEEGKPWIAYRQFCENFLGPLLLMRYSNRSLHGLQIAYPAGIPLQIIQSLLPWRSKLNMMAYLHIHLHAKLAGKSKGKDEKQATISSKKLLALFNSLENLVQSLHLKETVTEWSGYYDEAALRNGYLDQKKQIIENWLTNISGLKTGIDFGANEGVFSKLFSTRGIKTIAAEGDYAAVGKLYKKITTDKEMNILPLIIDLANPAPATGMNNKERSSFLTRVKDTDIGLALALIHHLCLGKNIPLSSIAELFSASCKNLVIEFVPKTDPKSLQLLLNKKDIYTEYSIENFEMAFSKFFKTLQKQTIPGTERVLYLMQRING
jgi:hypothetical protein